MCRYLMVKIRYIYNFRLHIKLFLFQNSSKSMTCNDENVKELRNKLLELNKSKKDIDESFDIDNFEIPLSEKRTYSIIEVFQVSCTKSYFE